MQFMFANGLRVRPNKGWIDRFTPQSITIQDVIYKNSAATPSQASPRSESLIPMVGMRKNCKKNQEHIVLPMFYQPNLWSNI